MTDHKPTDEQQAAIDGFATGENMVIEAAAGTGKTSTLRYLADVAPTQIGLYLAFNKGVQLEAERKFAGTNVAAKTAHALAYASLDGRMKDKLNRRSRLKPAERADILGIRGTLRFQSSEIPLQRHVMVRLVAETATQFCRSSQADITPDLVPVPAAFMLDDRDAADLQEVVAKYTRKYWADVTNPEGVLGYSHDHYMKTWALTDPKIDTDYILYDEAQDADSLVSSVIGRQTHAQIVAVGDRSQAIYGWRGAQNAMDAFGGERFQLTQSFRFGDAIADEANVWLDLLDASLRVRGSDKPSSVHPTHKRVPEAVLCRTNAGAIGEVIYSHSLNVPVAIAGKNRTRAMRDLAAAAQQLQEQGWTRHPDLDMFTSWTEVQDYVAEDEGSELTPLVKLVDQHGPAKLIKAIDQCVPEEKARTVIATAHAAKGLEWLHVRISDDFKVPGYDDDGNIETLPDGELMLCYVAVTRAQRHLDHAGLSWVRDYRRALRRPEYGMEWRRRYYDSRRAVKELMQVI